MLQKREMLATSALFVWLRFTRAAIAGLFDWVTRKKDITIIMNAMVSILTTSNTSRLFLLITIIYYQRHLLSVCLLVCLQRKPACCLPAHTSLSPPLSLSLLLRLAVSVNLSDIGCLVELVPGTNKLCVLITAIKDAFTGDYIIAPKTDKAPRARQCSPRDLSDLLLQRLAAQNDGITCHVLDSSLLATGRMSNYVSNWLLTPRQPRVPRERDIEIKTQKERDVDINHHTTVFCLKQLSISWVIG